MIDLSDTTVAIAQILLHQGGGRDPALGEPRRIASLSRAPSICSASQSLARRRRVTILNPSPVLRQQRHMAWEPVSSRGVIGSRRCRRRDVVHVGGSCMALFWTACLNASSTSSGTPPSSKTVIGRARRRQAALQLHLQLNMHTVTHARVGRCIVQQGPPKKLAVLRSRNSDAAMAGRRRHWSVSWPRHRPRAESRSGPRRQKMAAQHGAS
ncbi:hypothetical protein CKAH01_04103 [Colletotrichum kahawae]|uniref:Uncharacterized protein n=1 Tax=Colletotrichum kahawae TaxID=34407 RepID=A0AAE0DAC1_COLKA|nr:hypothetical protein CKAH01_04103 [Colletotrichum kahawae]